jgi:hypothetical protein
MDHQSTNIYIHYNAIQESQKSITLSYDMGRNLKQILFKERTFTRYASTVEKTLNKKEIVKRPT